MLFLLLTILLNAYLAVAFKIFERLGIDNLQAIVANYWVCVITGSIFIGRFPVALASLHQTWLPWALLMGVSFISIFNLIAYCTREDGITTTTIANKLSLVIPVAFALWLYHDRMTPLKGLGILLAAPAVYLSTRSRTDGAKRQNIWLAVILFFASGLLDTLVNFVTKKFFGNSSADPLGQSVFLIHAFAVAGTAGVGVVTYLLVRKKRRFSSKNLLAGLILGVPNFFSIYALMRLLQSGFLPGSAAIPVVNIGVVLSASIVALLAFRERASPARLFGMLLSITAILLIMFSDLHAHAT